MVNDNSTLLFLANRRAKTATIVSFPLGFSKIPIRKVLMVFRYADGLIDDCPDSPNKENGYKQS